METFYTPKLSSSHMIVFKSYYVVWKLKYKHSAKAQNESLNRTMQYGNDAAIKKAAKTNVV